jgi:hypothetical protein
MIDLAIQQLEDQRHSCFLCVRRDASEARDGGLQALGIIEPLTISTEADDVWYPDSLCMLNACLDLLFEPVMQIAAVKSDFQRLMSCDRRDRQAMIGDKGPIFGGYEIDGWITRFSDCANELFGSELLRDVAPPRHGLRDGNHFLAPIFVQRRYSSAPLERVARALRVLDSRVRFNISVSIPKTCLRFAAKKTMNI